MNVASSTSMNRKALSQMNKAELTEICNTLGVEFGKKDTNNVLVERIQESGLYKTVVEKSGASTKVVGGKRVHKLLGEYMDVIVHARDPKEGSIFASIGLYTVEFQPEEKISLPIGMIKFLKHSCTTHEHYFDKNAISENGNTGVHMTREVPKYIVELVDNRLD